jgi:uncharacterized protein YqeY
MSLEEKINYEIKIAMKSQDKVLLESLRAVKAAILLAKTEKSGQNELTEDQELKLLQRLVKQRAESAEIYKSQGRMDLYEREINEKSIIEKFLPQMMSVEQLVDELKKIIAQLGAKTPADMGKVMGMATKALAGKADNKLIAEKVKELLANG